MSEKEKSMKYVALAEGLNNRTLVPITQDISNYIGKKPDKDFYISLYKYNQEHFKKFKETNSLSGIKDVKTDKLLFDFDDGTNLDQAKNDAVELTQRLIEKGVPQGQIGVYFSGGKGFHIELKTTSEFSRREFTNIVFNLAKDLKTYDDRIVDEQRIIRAPLTRHQDTKLFKIPLTVDQLVELPMDIIKSMADSLENVDTDLIDNWIDIDLPELILELKDNDVKTNSEDIELNEELSFDKYQLNLAKCPKWLSPERYALQEGFFYGSESAASGERNDAFMILASTYKKNGINKNIAFNMLKGTAELQAARTGETQVPDYELKHNIINLIYSPDWNGGIYAPDHPLLIKTRKRFGIAEPGKQNDFTSSSEMFSSFIDYASNIEGNTIKTGLPIDEEVRLTIGMPVALLGAPSSGKCLGKDVPILMYDGTRKMSQDIKVGDVLMGDDSTPRTVLSTCTGRENLYNIKQNNGDDYVVNESHILSLKNNVSFKDKKRNKQFEKEKVDIELRQYLEKGKLYKKHYRGYKVGVNYPKQNVYIDPYFLGLWLGDGHSDRIAITTIDEEVKDYVYNIGKLNGLKVYDINYNSDRCPTYFLSSTRDSKIKNDLHEHFKGYELFNNKHIPNQFLVNDRYTRLRLLAGLLDSDGHYDKRNNKYEITFKSKRLINDTVILARSLGYKVSLGEKTVNEDIYHRAYINADDFTELPLLLDRKKGRNKKNRTDISLTSFEVEPLGEGDYYGFEIDGNRRFLLGDFTVTHNTTVALNILRNTSKQGIHSVFFSMDMHRALICQKQLHLLFSHKSDLIYENILREDILTKYAKGLEENFGNVTYMTKAGLTVEDIRYYIEKKKDEVGDSLKLVLIDYLECIRGPYSDPTTNSAIIADGIKNIAVELDVCVILLVQPPKITGGAAFPLTNMYQIKGSSMVAQAMRTVIGIYREGFSPETPDDDNFITFVGLKNSMGSLFKTDCYWNGARGEIDILDEIGQQNLENLRNKLKKERIGDDF